MRDPFARDSLRRHFDACDERQRHAVEVALQIAGQKAAAAECRRLTRVHRAIELLRGGMSSIEVESVLTRRFRVGRTTAWRDRCDAEASISRIAPR